MKKFLIKFKAFRFKKQVVIISALIVLNLIFGLDLRFTIINLVWLLV